MPVMLEDFVKTLTLPDGVSAELMYYSDVILIWKDGKQIGSLTRREIDDNLAHKKLKDILDDSHNVGERLPDSD